MSIKLQPIKAATALGHLRIPVVGRGLQTEPVGVLQQVRRPFVIALQRQQPVLVGLQIDPGSPLMAVHGVETAGRGHPIVAGQTNVGIGDFMYKLRHRGVAGLEREAGTDLIFDGSTGVGTGKGLTLDMEERHIQTAIETPAAAECHLVLGIEIPLRGSKMAC